MSAFILRRSKLGRSSCRGISEASQTGIKRTRNILERKVLRYMNERPEYVFRWGCVSELPDTGHKPIIVNDSKAIHKVSDKSGFRKTLNEAELCPKTYHSVQAALQAPKLDFVVRPRVHAQGRHIYRCKTAQELQEAFRRCGEGAYISDFIDKVAEYRVFVAQGRAVWVTNKTPGNPQDLAWNVAKGGRFDNVGWKDWPLKVVKNAIEAHKLSGLDFSGVDVMVDREGNTYVLEINSAPSQTSPYRQECVAKAFDYIVRNGKKEIPLIEERGGYKKFIHPGVCPDAHMRGN